MKSRLLKSMGLSDEGQRLFTRDLKLATELPTTAQRLITSQMVNLANKRTPAEQAPVVATLEGETGLSVPELNRVLAVLTLFMSAFENAAFQKDTPADWADDLTEMGVLANEPARLQFLQLIEHLRENVSGDITSIVRTRSASSGVMPFFEFASTTVELRAVPKADFEWGTDVSKYQPELLSTTPVISVAIVVDSGLPKRFAFQASPEGLQYLIQELQSALKIAALLKAEPETKQ